MNGWEKIIDTVETLSVRRPQPHNTNPPVGIILITHQSHTIEYRVTKIVPQRYILHDRGIKVLRCFEVLQQGGAVFYGQEPPSGESTTTECGKYYIYLYVIYLPKIHIFYEF